MLIKQPNGKYCYYNKNGLSINITKDDYILIRVMQLKKELNNLTDESLPTISDLIKITKVSDEQLKSMGYDKTYDEMLKYIPRRVLNTSYYGRDCTTYGKCPTCNAPVQDGIGFTDKTCSKCGQVLDWR